MAGKGREYYRKRQKMRLFTVAFACMAVVLSVALIWALLAGQKSDPLLPESSSQSQGSGSQTASSSPAQSSAPRSSAVQGNYDYSAPVPTSTAVGDEYFADAVFIGDSRTQGLQKFSGPGNAAYYTATGLKVDTIFTEAIVKTDSGKITVLDALKTQKFRKVYVMLGVNELGWVYSDMFIAKYGELVDQIKALQPGAAVYAQSILPITKARSDKDSIYNNGKINEFNALIKTMATNKKVYYLNVAECLTGDDGALFADGSTDGIHLDKKYCDIWFDYIRAHTAP